jgi:hypothetical protein
MTMAMTFDCLQKAEVAEGSKFISRAHLRHLFRDCKGCMKWNEGF